MGFVLTEGIYSLNISKTIEFEVFESYNVIYDELLIVFTSKKHYVKHYVCSCLCKYDFSLVKQIRLLLRIIRVPYLNTCVLLQYV